MSTDKMEPVIASEPIPEWPAPCRALMQNPTVQVNFRGLLAFCYNEDTSECEVGVVNQSDHFLSVEVFEDEKNVHQWTDHAAAVVNESYFIKGSDDLPYVCFFQPTTAFDRNVGHQNDFRWILDLESSEFYGPRSGERRRLDRRSSALKPRLKIDTGQFFTLLRSNCSYRRQDFGGTASSKVHLGKIAAEMAVRIFLGPNDYLSVLLPGGFNTRFTSRKQYRVNFSNDCDDESCLDPTSNNPELQNDFHFYHSTFNRRPEDPLLYLMKEDSSCVEPILGKLEGTDRAPCACSGYGSGGTLGG